MAQTSIASFLQALLDHEFDLLQRSLDESVEALHGRLGLNGTYRSGANIILTKQEYLKDIDSRKKSFLAIVQKTLPVFGSEPQETLLRDLKDVARKYLGLHVSELEKKLREHAERLGFADLPDLDLDASMVLSAIDAELEILMRSPTHPAESTLEQPGLIDEALLGELRSLSTDKFDLSRLIASPRRPTSATRTSACMPRSCLPVPSWIIFPRSSGSRRLPTSRINIPAANRFAKWPNTLTNRRER